MLRKVKVDEIMVKDVVSVAPTDSILKVAKLIKEHKIHGMPVLEGSKVVGIITTKDIAGKVVANEKNPGEVLVRDIMTEKVIFGYVEDELSEISEKFIRNKISRMPILDKEDNLAGIVTQTDVIDAYPDFYKLPKEKSEWKLRWHKKDYHPRE